VSCLYVHAGLGARGVALVRIPVRGERRVVGESATHPRLATGAVPPERREAVITRPVAEGAGSTSNIVQSAQKVDFDQ
jgi:hypothetical protein